MSNEGKNIKNYTHYLWILMSINLLIFVCVVTRGGFNFNLVNETYKSMFIKNGIVMTVSTLITFVLNGLLPSNFKSILVFWRVKNIYPGCRVFTKLIDKDCRIDKSVLTRLYGELPIEPEAQNKLWYKIFKKNEFDPMIFDSHRSFLLSRDLTGLCFLFLVIYSVLALIAKFSYNISFMLLFPYLGFLFFQYVIFSFISRNYGNRFACNALAKASSDFK